MLVFRPLFFQLRSMENGNIFKHISNIFYINKLGMYTKDLTVLFVWVKDDFNTILQILSLLDLFVILDRL